MFFIVDSEVDITLQLGTAHHTIVSLAHGLSVGEMLYLMAPQDQPRQALNTH
jgi:hypothetical protein